MHGEEGARLWGGGRRGDDHELESKMGTQLQELGHPLASGSDCLLPVGCQDFWMLS